MFNGCSYVDNVHLQHESSDWYQQNWPAQMARRAGKDYKNLAKSGASNTRIFRTSVDAIMRQECDILIIGWTNKEREELPHQSGDWIRVRPDETGYDRGQGPDVHNHWYRHHHNEWINLWQLVRYIVIVQQLADHNGIDVMMFNSIWHNNLHDPIKELRHSYHIQANEFGKHEKEYQDFLSLYELIDWNRWLLESRTTLAELAKEQDLEFDDTGHLVLSAQETVARIMTEKYDGIR